MLPFEERLEQFGQKTTALIDELVALTQSTPVTESAVAAQAVLGRYGRLMAQIGELSAQAQLSGLQAVCALVETNILLLQDDKRALTTEEAATLETWPMLLLGYLANRADRDASMALLNSLGEHWPITLPLESVADELKLLTGQTEPVAVEPFSHGEPAPAQPLLAAGAPAMAAPAEQASEDSVTCETPMVPVGLAAFVAEDPEAASIAEEGLSAPQEPVWEVPSPEEQFMPLPASAVAAEQGSAIAEPAFAAVAPEEAPAGLAALAAEVPLPVMPDEMLPAEVALEEIAPEVIEPQAIEPQAIEPQAIEPQAIESQAIEPQAIEPQAIEPQAIESQAIEPQPIEPQAIEPEAIEPEAIEPEAIEPEASAFEAHEAKPIELATPMSEVPIFAESPATGAMAEDDTLERETVQQTAEHEAVTGADLHSEATAAFASTLPPPESTTQHVTRAMLDILLDELKPLNEAFESVLAAASEGSADERLGAFGELLDFMERLRTTAETIGLTALAALLTRISFELLSLPDGLLDAHRDLLLRMPRAMVAYLQAPDAPAASAGLVVLLADKLWAAPLAGTALAAWRAALADIELTDTVIPDVTVASAPTMIESALPETPTPAIPAEEILAEEPVPEEITPEEILEEEPVPEEIAPEQVAPEQIAAEPVGQEVLAPLTAMTEALPAPASIDLPEPPALSEAGEESLADTHPLPLPATDRQFGERPMINILLDELQPLNNEFRAAISAATQGSVDERLSALGDLLDFLERVKITVEAIGLTALAALLGQIGWEVISLPEGLAERHAELLHRLPQAIMDYLRAPDDETACAELVALLADRRWSVTASGETQAAWRLALSDIELSETSHLLTPSRPSEATPGDVSLDLPQEVNSELLEGLLNELPVQVSNFTTSISSITVPGGTTADTEQAMRAAHTLKGAANTVGIPGIANLTHQLEDILLALMEAEQMPRGQLADLLIDASDCLEAMSEFLLGLGSAPDNAQAILQNVLDWANRMDREGLSALLAETSPSVLETAPVPAVASAATAAPAPVPAQAGRSPARADEAEDRAHTQPVAEQSLRVPAPLVDELLSLAGESLISNSQLQDHLKSTIVQNRAVYQQHQLIIRLVAELETLVDIRGITSQQQAAEQSDGFDALEFEHYNELQTISRQLMEAATDAREMANMAEQELDALDEVLGDQQRLQMANQHALLRTRMMPVSNIIPRLQRSVRQTGRLLDKPVEFTVKGESTRMDTNVLNDLMDPLMHMLRNAVDHGIEKPDARVSAGKTPEGHIELSFAREGDTIVVRCRDDGAGLDHEAIRRIAESKGMIVPGHIHTNEELARLILMPGFSTRDEASQVSGRGVGMDVVYSRVQEMKGMLALHSDKGKGLTIELRLPATMLSMHALIIRQRERRLAISTRGVEDIRYVPRENVVEIGARQFVRDGEKIYALIRLEQVLSMAPDRRAKDRVGHPVLLVRMEDGSERAVLVQEVLESREVVMKKFNRYVPQVGGIIGGTILGNGEVAPVIDLFDLLHAPMKKLAAVQRAQGVGGNAALEAKPKRALVVDDSLSARRAVVQLLKDEGYEIRTANDGLEAVTVLEKWVPDIIISDMEMPRMNGLELTSNIRHAEQTRHVPVIMITSRSTAKHRQMSAAAGVNLHMIKPFSDDELVTQVAKLTENVQ